MSNHDQDLENPLLNHISPIQKPLPKKLLASLTIAILLFLTIHSTCTSNKPIESTLTSVVLSSFNVSTTRDKIHGSWDVTLQLDKDVHGFRYEGRAWIFSADDYDLVHVDKVKGWERVVRGSFVADSGEDFRREDGLMVDLVLEVDATFRSWWAKEAFVTISCEDLKVEFDRDDLNKIGVLQGGERSCATRFYSSKFVGDGVKNSFRSVPINGWFHVWGLVMRIGSWGRIL